jgi:hypothetical protein
MSEQSGIREAWNGYCSIALRLEEKTHGREYDYEIA